MTLASPGLPLRTQAQIVQDLRTLADWIEVYDPSLVDEVTRHRLVATFRQYRRRVEHVLKTSREGGRASVDGLDFEEMA